MAKVIGLGGVFIKFRNPQSMCEWYRNTLGIITNDYGVLFEFGAGQVKKSYLQLGTFEENTTYFGAPEQQYMLNFRVDNLEELREILIEKKVSILDEIESYSYGKFLHIEDPEGNRLELWEPIDSDFEANETSIMTQR